MHRRPATGTAAERRRRAVNVLRSLLAFLQHRITTTMPL
jgi:hypothetical protein